MTEDRLRSYGVLSLAPCPRHDVHRAQRHLHAYDAYAGWDGQVLRFDRTAGLARLCDFVAEAVGGILLILGIRTRWVALTLSPILIGATWVHSGNGWLFASTDGGWEYPLYLFVLCIAQATLGDGAYALAPSRLSARQLPKSSII
jgi:uncharacterized membrane protein YphA (DoxX/SURF4 family)